MEAQQGTRNGRSLLAGLTLVLGLLVATALMRTDQSKALTVPVACGAVCALLFIAWRWGLAWSDLGMARADIGSGVRWGAVAVAIVALGYAAVVMIPASESALTDARTPADAGQVALKVLVIIPLRTVLIEEIAFRGVLWGMISKTRSSFGATLGSAAAFGVWHIPPALLAIDSNEALARAAGGSAFATAGGVLAIVVLTGLFGVVLTELRRRSGSLLAPACLHWATNGLGTVTSFLV